MYIELGALQPLANIIYQLAFISLHFHAKCFLPQPQ